jgi:hypothetical protein
MIAAINPIYLVILFDRPFILNVSGWLIFSMGSGWLIKSGFLNFHETIQFLVLEKSFFWHLLFRGRVPVY